MSKILIEKIDFCKQCPYFGPAFPSGNACERVSRTIEEPENLPEWCPLPDSSVISVNTEITIHAPICFQEEKFKRELVDIMLKHLASNP